MWWFGLWVDMDVLLIVEVMGFGYSSCYGGCMYVCGYDGYIVMLFGVVCYLVVMWCFDGILVLIF